MKVTIYTSTNCQFSKAEKDYLTTKNIPFEEKNVEANREYLTEMLAVGNNFAGTPVTKIEKDNGASVVLKGFSQEEFDRELGLQTASVAPTASPDVTMPLETPPAVESAAQGAPAVTPPVSETPSVASPTDEPMPPVTAAVAEPTPSVTEPVVPTPVASASSAIPSLTPTPVEPSTPAVDTNAPATPSVQPEPVSITSSAPAVPVEVPTASAAPATTTSPAPTAAPTETQSELDAILNNLAQKVQPADAAPAAPVQAAPAAPATDGVQASTTPPQVPDFQVK